MNLLMIIMIRLMANQYLSSFSVLAATPGGGSGSFVWSDRKEAEEGGNITAINIKKRRGVSIDRIRTR